MYILKQLILGVVAASTVSVAGAAPSRHHSSSSNQNQLQTQDGGLQQQHALQHALHEDKVVNTTKYFHEPGGGLELGHYDARFFQGEVAYAEHRAVLRQLIRSYLTTMRALRVETWLAHGTLLGWWWNGQVMPWDYDLDVQVTTTTLHYLAKHFNHTLHTYTDRDGESKDNNNDSNKNTTTTTTTTTTTQKPKAKQYLLDINPYYAEASRQDGRNVIDARWIDTSNGMFVDITGLMEQRFADTLGPAPGLWSCKNYHHYATTDLWPLRRSEFEGVAASVPYGFDPVLRGEYGAKSMRATVWQGHRWQPARKEWVKIVVGEQEGDAVLE
ncbi:LicD family-domain-containing protein [Apiospora phragmitis]|uniref:LicD family-domain-containing protein n=1 Tax=Apiospora phragmitis TaxID=2905665 RepID=A0ABR1WW05_9PEZI